MNWQVEVTDITWGFLVKPPIPEPFLEFRLIEADYLPCRQVQFVDVTTASPNPLKHVVFFTIGSNLPLEDWHKIASEFGRSHLRSSFILVHGGEHRTLTATTLKSTHLAEVAASIAASHNSGTLDDPVAMTVRLGEHSIVVEPPSDMTMFGIYSVSRNLG